MTQVTHLVIETPLMKQARNMTLAIIDLAKKRDLTPEQYRGRMHAIDMLAREAHDTIVEAEYEQQTCSQSEGMHDPSSRKTSNP